MEIQSTGARGQELLARIRNRIRSKLNVREESSSTVPSPNAAAPVPDFSALRQMAQVLQNNCMTLGRAPLQPPTLRGRIGAVLVRLVQRMLFWYTPQINGFQSMTAAAIGEHLKQAELLEAACGDLQRQVAGLAREIDDVRTAAASNGQDLRVTRLLKELGETQSAVRALIAREQETQVRERETLGAEVSGLRRRLDQEADALRRLEAAAAELPAAMRTLTTAVEHDRRAAAETRAELFEAVSRLARRFELERTESPRGSCADAATMRERPDAWYLSFENEFRGPRSEIKNNMTLYLPFLREAAARNANSPVLDIGCGRGEWLELLRDEGFTASGVDRNSAMVAHCREHGLIVTDSDAIAHLRVLPAASLGAVTAFHVIEHLPLPTLMALLKETVRVLKPGGIVIFETPNPSNVLVGTHNFYLDPTHRNPLPGLLAKFLLEAHGLTGVTVKPLNPCPGGTRVPDDGTEIVRRFNEYFYGPQDYAVMGYKA